MLTKVRQSQVLNLNDDLNKIKQQIKTFKEPISLLADMPLTDNNDGDLRVCLENGNVYIWNDKKQSWELSSGISGTYGKILTLFIDQDKQTEIKTGIKFEDETAQYQTNSTLINLYINGILIRQECYETKKIDNELVIIWIDQDDYLHKNDEIGIQYYDILGGESFNISYNGSNIDLSNISSTILPSTASTIDIGSKDKPFRSIYVDEARISANTLYVDGVPVIGSTNEDIIVKADIDQGISVKTFGTGSTKVTSENKVEIASNGVNADVDIKAIGSDSKVNVNGETQINFTSKTINFNGEVNAKNLLSANDLTVKGNLIVQGTTTTIDSQNLTVKDNIIELNKGQIGNGVSAGTAGIKVDRGDELPYMILFDEADDMFKVGQQGNLENIASREWTTNKINEIINSNIEPELTDQEIEDMINEIWS